MQIKVLLGHMLEIITPIDNDGVEVDETMLNSYLQEQTDNISKALQIVIDSCKTISTIYTNDKIEDESLFQEAFFLLMENYKQIFPNPEQEPDGQFETKVDLVLLRNWKERLDLLQETISSIFLMFLFDGLKRIEK